MFFTNSKSDIPQVSVDALKNSLDKKETMLLLDVRTPDEYEKGKIGKSINIPLNELRQRVGTVIPDKKQKIYVYCLSGLRSTAAAGIMITLGYKNVFSVRNGLLEWRVKQYPITGV